MSFKSVTPHGLLKQSKEMLDSLDQFQFYFSGKVPHIKISCQFKTTPDSNFERICISPLSDVFASTEEKWQQLVNFLSFLSESLPNFDFEPIEEVTKLNSKEQIIFLEAMHDFFNKHALEFSYSLFLKHLDIQNVLLTKQTTNFAIFSFDIGNAKDFHCSISSTGFLAIQDIAGQNFSPKTFLFQTQELFSSVYPDINLTYYLNCHSQLFVQPFKLLIFEKCLANTQYHFIKTFDKSRELLPRYLYLYEMEKSNQGDANNGIVQRKSF